jgi:peptide-methionine (S)-S-oxide reductase
MSQFDTATLAGGCFWCTEAIFTRLKGVTSVVSGYAASKVENPSYKEVCTGRTGAAEAIQITYDPSVIPYAKLLEIFWHVHDPTTLNRQGNDVGTQYRSVIFYQNAEQKEIAEKYIDQLTKNKTFSNPIVTTLEPFVKFYPAEDYHQNYFNENGEASYCHYVVRPKVEKFEKMFSGKLKKRTP